MADLLDLLREKEHAVDPRKEWVHIVLPSMGYACEQGDCLGLDDGGPAGRWVLGWDDSVTCPGCRAPGHRAISRACHLQQMGTDHVCRPLADLTEHDHPGCRHWQTITEGENA